MATKYLLPDAIVNLEPPSLGARLGMLEEALRLLNERTSRIQRDFVELRERVILDKAGGGNRVPRK